MRIDSLNVRYDNISGGTQAVIRPSAGTPFASMSATVKRGDMPIPDFRASIISEARALAAEITEIEEGVDLNFDPKAEINKLLDHAALIPSNEWLRRYNLVNQGLPWEDASPCDEEDLEVVIERVLPRRRGCLFGLFGGG
jgi:hypothetical protein